jgi:hypothetical protein
MHLDPQLRVDIFQLGCHPLADRPTVYRKVARLVVGPTDMSET